MAHAEQMQFVAHVKSAFPEHFEGKNVLEIGSMNINGSVRQFFEDCDYLGVDVAPGPDVDIVGIAHEVSLEAESFDVVISCETLEHDMHWEKTIEKALEVLMPGGLLIITCASGNRPEHGTRRRNPQDSGTTQIEGWADYYRNLERSDLEAVLRPDTEFSAYEFSSARDGQDLNFWGVRA